MKATRLVWLLVVVLLCGCTRRWTGDDGARHYVHDSWILPCLLLLSGGLVFGAWMVQSSFAELAREERYARNRWQVLPAMFVSVACTFLSLAPAFWCAEVMVDQQRIVVRSLFQTQEVRFDEVASIDVTNSLNHGRRVALARSHGHGRPAVHYYLDLTRHTGQVVRLEMAGLVEKATEDILRTADEQGIPIRDEVHRTSFGSQTHERVARSR